ncbi:MAG: MerR family transcriptional regulator [Cyanobacteria bacterium J06639_1]
MVKLQQIPKQQQWSLEAFVDLANELLPTYLPADDRVGRSRSEVNPRLVRHYTSQGLLDKPERVGKTARYTYRHLLQLLVVRRMMAEGYAAAAIDRFAVEKPNAELEALLQGGVQLTTEVANPALSFLHQIKAKTAPVKRRSRPSSSSSAKPDSLQPTRWERQEILPGLELHVRSDFQPPRSQRERDALMRLIRDRLFDSP